MNTPRLASAAQSVLDLSVGSVPPPAGARRHAGRQPAPASDAAPASDDVGIAIGRDYARHGLVPPADHLHGEHPVRLGWQAARPLFQGRTLKATRHVRRWLALRLQAWLQGRPFEEVRVTPRYLAQLEPERCPVTRAVLTEGLGAQTDAVVVALNPQAGIAAGHLAIVSRRAAQALAGRSAEALVAKAEAGDDALDAEGLDAAAWQRLITLVRFVSPADHRRMAVEPLAVLPPARLHLLNPAQALQAVISQVFEGPAWGRRIGDLGALFPEARSRRAFSVFASALLARCLAAGGSAALQAAERRHALEDAWVHPVVERRWAELAQTLHREDCERIVRLAHRRGLADGTHWLDDGEATEGWALSSEAVVTA